MGFPLAKSSQLLIFVDKMKIWLLSRYNTNCQNEQAEHNTANKLNGYGRVWQENNVFYSICFSWETIPAAVEPLAQICDFPNANNRYAASLRQGQLN